MEKQKCFICGKAVTEKDMSSGEVEMIKGPGFYNDKSPYYEKRVFVCIDHAGVSSEVKE